MPVHRPCRTCGAPLTGDLGWCGRCHAPTRGFTPRAPLHEPGTVVGPLVHTGGYAPHWSRWERSTTTFGPLGRIVATLALAASLPLALSFGMLLYLVVFPMIAVPVLGSIWARGWVVPGERGSAPLPDPVRDEPAPEPPLTTAQLVWRAAWWTLVVAGCAAFAYGPVPVKAAVLAGSTLIGLYAFWRGFLSR